MKLNIRKAALAATLVSALTTPLAAQNTRSGYFLEDYTYRFEMNPAYDNSRNFVSMPGVGNINMSMDGTLHVSDVIYNVEGQTTTFLNPQISTEEALKNISDKNRIGTDLKLTILAGGFKAFGGYNTIAINARANAGVHLPGSVFRLLKEGVKNTTYDISNLGARATAYGEIALNHSHQLSKKVRIGGTMKFLIGGGYADAQLKNSSLTLGENDWSIVSDGEVQASVKGLQYKTKVNDHTGNLYVNGAKIDGTGINGFGVAFDLGVIYQPGRDWRLSASILDLGFIKWNNNMVASTNGPKQFNTDRYTFNVDDDATNSFKNQWENMRDDLTALYELEDMGDKGSATHALGATLNLGVEYTLPAYRKLSFGLLNTTRIHGAYSWTDFRVSANIAPAKCFDAGINMTAGTFGVGFGWIVNLHPKGFNLFLGMDRTLGKLAKQGVPLNSNAQVNLGINFPF